MRTRDPRIAVAVLVVCGAIFPLAAQQKKPPKPPPPQKAQAHPGGKPSEAVKRLNENPTGELDRFTQMSPQQREKELSKLPPQRRAAFEQHLARYMQMTPEQQQKARQTVEMMQSLPKDRQNAIKQEIQRLQALPGPQRRKILGGDEFNQNFSPDEQTLIRDRFPNIPKPDRAPISSKD
jgi:hypothetical protein